MRDHNTVEKGTYCHHVNNSLYHRRILAEELGRAELKARLLNGNHVLVRGREHFGWTMQNVFGNGLFLTCTRSVVR